MSWTRPAAFIATLAALLAGCATTSSYGSAPVFGKESWRRALLERGVDPSSAVYPFEATPEMVAWAHRRIDRYTTMVPSQRLVMLQSAFFDPQEMTFSYDDTLTLTAPRAFAEGRGNCLSFTALFVAVSRALGMPTVLVSVERRPEVERQDDVVVVNRHVAAAYRETGKVHVFDFYESSQQQQLVRRIVDDLVATAMFHTNLGAETIRAGDLAAAERHLELATTIAPDWAPGWINLGVVRARQGRPREALAMYQAALRADQGNPSALTNMAVVYRQLGLDAEARAALIAASRGPSSPFTLIALADVELARGDVHQATRLLRRARRTWGGEPCVFDALARLAARSGDDARAERYRQRAIRLRARGASLD